MKKLFLTPLAVALLSLTGCVNVPKTEITGSLGGKPVALKCPKDMEAESITFKSETNGVVSLEIKNIKTRMNPDVITTSAQGQALIIDTAFKAGAAAAGQVAGAVAKP